MLFDTYLTHKALIKFFATCPSAIEKKPRLAGTVHIQINKKLSYLSLT